MCQNHANRFRRFEDLSSQAFLGHPVYYRWAEMQLVGHSNALPLPSGDLHSISHLFLNFVVPATSENVFPLSAPPIPVPIELINMLKSLHFAWDVAEAKCILATAVCVSVCLCLAAFSHYCRDPDVTWGNDKGAFQLCTIGRIFSRSTGFVAMII